MAKYDVGDAILKIRPSLDGFVAELKAQLEAINEVLEILVTLNFKRANDEMRTWRAFQEARSVDLTVRVDEEAASSNMSAWRERQEANDVTQTAQADTGAASTQMGAWRERQEASSVSQSADADTVAASTKMSLWRATQQREALRIRADIDTDGLKAALADMGDEVQLKSALASARKDLRDDDGTDEKATSAILNRIAYARQELSVRKSIEDALKAANDLEGMNARDREGALDRIRKAEGEVARQKVRSGLDERATRDALLRSLGSEASLQDELARASIANDHERVEAAREGLAIRKQLEAANRSDEKAERAAAVERREEAKRAERERVDSNQSRAKILEDFRNESDIKADLLRAEILGDQQAIAARKEELRLRKAAADVVRTQQAEEVAAAKRQGTSLDPRDRAAEAKKARDREIADTKAQVRANIDLNQSNQDILDSLRDEAELRSDVARGTANDDYRRVAAADEELRLRGLITRAIAAENRERANRDRTADVDSDGNDDDDSVRRSGDVDNKFRVVQGFRGLTLFNLGNISAAATGIAGIVGLLGGVVAAALAAGTALGVMAGAVAVGASGVIGAFQELTAESKTSGETVKDTSREQREELDRVADASERLGDTQRDAARNQRDLSRAWRDATRDLRDMNLQLEDATLSQEGAAIAVQRAKDRAEETKSDFRKGKASALDVQEANLGIKEAQVRLRGTQNTLADKRVDTGEANAVGVAGSDRVQDSQQQFADSLRDMAKAQRELAQAQADVGRAAAQAAEPTSRFDKAMEKLSPNARAFVNQVRALGPEWTKLRTAVQDRLFDGLGASVQTVARIQLPELQRGMSVLAGMANSVLKDTMTQVSDTFTEFSNNGTFDAFLSSTVLSFKNFAPVIDSLVRALTGLTIGMGPALGNMFGALAQYINDATPMFTRLGTSFTVEFTKMFPILNRFFSAMEPIFIALMPIITEAFGALTGVLENNSGRLGMFAEQMGGALVNALKALGPLIPPITQLFGSLAEIIGGMPSGLLSAIILTTILTRSFFGMFIAIGNTAGRMMAAWTSMSSFASGTAGIFSRVGAGISSAFSTAYTTMGVGAINAKEKLAKSAANVGSAFSGAAANVKRAAVAAWITTADLATRAWNRTVVLAGVAWKWITALPAKIAATTVAQKIAAGATKVWAGAQWALNAAMNSNFLGVIIMAIAALVFGLIYAWKNSETFRNIVLGAWKAVQIGVKAAIDVVMVYLRFLFAYWKAVFSLGAALVKAWFTVFKGAFDAVVIVIKLWWETVKLYFGIVKDVFLGFIGFFRDIFTGNWNAIWDNLWDKVDSIWGRLKGFFGSIGDAFKGLGEIGKNVGRALWTAFQGVVGIIKAPLHVIGRLLKQLPKTFMKVPIPGVATLHSWGDKLSKLRDGGAVAGRDSSGRLHGPGGPRDDQVLGVDPASGAPTAWVSPQEYVINARSAAMYRPEIEAMNAGTYKGGIPKRSDGGWVGDIPKLQDGGAPIMGSNPNAEARARNRKSGDVKPGSDKWNTEWHKAFALHVFNGNWNYTPEERDQALNTNWPDIRNMWKSGQRAPTDKYFEDRAKKDFQNNFNDAWWLYFENYAWNGEKVDRDGFLAGNPQIDRIYRSGKMPPAGYIPPQAGDAPTSGDTFNSTSTDRPPTPSPDGEFGDPSAGFEGGMDDSDDGYADTDDSYDPSYTYGGGGDVGFGGTGGTIANGSEITSGIQQSMWDAIRTAFPDVILSSGTRYADVGSGFDNHMGERALDLSGPNMPEYARWIYKLNQTQPVEELIHAPLNGWENLKAGAVLNYGPGTDADHYDHVHWAMANPVTASSSLVPDNGLGGGTDYPDSFGDDGTISMDDWNTEPDLDEEDGDSVADKLSVPKMFGKAGEILGEGLLAFFGLENSVLSGNNPYNRAVSDAFKEDEEARKREEKKKNSPSVGTGDPSDPSTQDLLMYPGASGDEAGGFDLGTPGVKITDPRFDPNYGGNSGGGSGQSGVVSGLVTNTPEGDIADGKPGAKAAVNRAFQPRGWHTGDQWLDTLRLVNKESSWNPDAGYSGPVNSDAYGLFQFLSTTWATVGETKTSDPYGQGIAGAKYIAQKYQTPSGAWNAWNNNYDANGNHWYADGGYVNGPGGPRDDAIRARLSNGEFVVDAQTTAIAGEVLEWINGSPANAGALVSSIANGVAPGSGAIAGPVAEQIVGGLAVGAESAIEAGVGFLQARELGSLANYTGASAAGRVQAPAQVGAVTNNNWSVTTADPKQFIRAWETKQAQDNLALLNRRPR